MNLQVVTSCKRHSTSWARVFLVTCVKAHMAIPTSLVLKEAAAQFTFEWHLVLVILFVPVQETQPRKGPVAELTWVRSVALGDSPVFDEELLIRFVTSIPSITGI